MPDSHAGALTKPAIADDAELAALLVASIEDAAIVALDADGRFANWNAGARRLYGHERDDILCRHLSVLDSPDSVPSRRPVEMLEAARTQGTVRDRAWQARRDGSRFWASLTITALRDESGALRGFSQVTRDLTDVPFADTPAATTPHGHAITSASEDRFGLAFTHAPIGISITGLNGNERGTFVELNPAFAHMMGYEPAELAGTFVADVTHPEDVEITRQAVAGLHAGETVSLEKRFLHRDGSEIWTLVSSTPMPDPAGHGSLYAISQVLDISERRRFEGQLRHLADHDTLTGLFNRHRFESELHRVTSEIARYGRRAALLVVDLDGFKDVNDQFGHQAGDALVVRLAALLGDTVRNSDVVARIGGDEFAIILPDTTLAAAQRLAERILLVIREQGHVTFAQRRAQITASIGMTTFDGASGLTGSELVVEADIAMYDAKANGGNRCEHYTRGAGLHRHNPTRHSWLDRLRTAIRDDQFVLHAQPIPAICGNGVPRFELLLRLPDTDGSLIAPAAFLYHAERFDLMGEIDRLVLRRAVTLLESHAAAGNDISLAVNLSGKTMNDAALPNDLAAVLAAHPISAGRLVIEVTETAAIVDIDGARELSAALRTLGCQFALDDFGSGFASFYYLKHLDFDFLKIDGEFVRDLARTSTDQLVVRAAVDIARELGTSTVAEFVGDAATVEVLRSLGVDYGQGYHLGRPGPLDEVLPPLSVTAP